MSIAPLAAAFAWLDAVPWEGTETVPLASAHGRVLAAPIRAEADLPDRELAFRNGYAVRAAATEGASPYNPVAPAGGVAPVRAGSSLPPGADAVLPAESVEGGTVVDPIAPGEGVVRRGEHMRAGATLYPAGHRLRAIDIGLLDTLHIPALTVRRAPRVEVLAGGSLLKLLLAEHGAISTGEDGDLVLAVGPHPSVRVEQHGIALRPGTESGFGWRGSTPALVLPEDPLACLAAYTVLAARLVRRMSGFPEKLPEMVTLRRKISSGVGYADLVRVRLSEGEAEPIGGVERGGLAGAVQADGYVLVPERSEGFPPGRVVAVYRF
jgi:molybdopterin molybdotransferase